MAEQDPVRVLSTSGASAAQLDDKYSAASGRVYLSGYQALVRLLLI